MENKKLERIMLEYLEDIFNTLQYNYNEDWKKECNNSIEQFEKFYNENWYKLSPKNFLKISKWINYLNEKIKCINCINEKIDGEHEIKPINVKTYFLEYLLCKLLKQF